MLEDFQFIASILTSKTYSVDVGERGSKLWGYCFPKNVSQFFLIFTVAIPTGALNCIPTQLHAVVSRSCGVVAV